MDRFITNTIYRNTIDQIIEYFSVWTTVNANPISSKLRRYRVRIHGRPDTKILNDLVDGVTVDGIRYKSIHAELDRQQGANAWLTVSLIEGKNREIRRVMEHFGWHVS